MSMKTKVSIAVLWLVFVFIITHLTDFPRKGTIIEFVNDAVIIASENGKRVTLIEEYHTYIPAGEQWSVGDKVIVIDGLFSELTIHRLTE